MFALTADQLELLHRASEGPPMWGGSMATQRLQRDVGLLLSMRLVEPDSVNPYRLTLTGVQVLEAHRLSLEGK